MKRSKMRPGSFALPGEKRYPITDVAHARNAIARVGQNGTPAEKAKVYGAVKRKFPALAERSTVIPTRRGPGRRIGQPKGARSGKR